jgi:hypothetical protein
MPPEWNSSFIATRRRRLSARRDSVFAGGRREEMREGEHELVFHALVIVLTSVGFLLPSMLLQRDNDARRRLNATHTRNERNVPRAQIRRKREIDLVKTGT